MHPEIFEAFCRRHPKYTYHNYSGVTWQRDPNIDFDVNALFMLGAPPIEPILNREELLLSNTPFLYNSCMQDKEFVPNALSEYNQIVLYSTITEYLSSLGRKHRYDLKKALAIAQTLVVNPCCEFPESLARSVIESKEGFFTQNLMMDVHERAGFEVLVLEDANSVIGYAFTQVWGDTYYFYGCVPLVETLTGKVTALALMLDAYTKGCMYFEMENVSLGSRTDYKVHFFNHPTHLPVLAKGVTEPWLTYL